MKRKVPDGMVRRLSWFGFVLFFILSGAAFAGEPAVPVVDGHLGRCSTDFTVLDSTGRPVYNARIKVVVHYGFLGIRRMSLEVGTNSQGKARVAGLPESQKDPLEFEVTGGRNSKKVLVDTAAKCTGETEVRFGTQ